jgi:hypothetical protein
MVNEAQINNSLQEMKDRELDTEGEGLRYSPLTKGE